MTSQCICPRTDGYRIKRRGCPPHAEKDAGHWQKLDERKYGTETPHEPTDEFIRQAFAEGARSLWPDSRDPGWIATFNRWLDTRFAEAEYHVEQLRDARDRAERMIERAEPKMPDA